MSAAASVLGAGAPGLRLLVLGGLNVDVLIDVEGFPPDDGCALVTSYATGFGGHAGNSATAIARLGAAVDVVGAVGDDAEGAALLDDLRRDGVGTARVAVRAGTPTGRVVIPTLPDGRRMLMYRGANDTLTPTEADAALAAGGIDGVVLADPPVALLDGVLRRCAAAGLPVYWNPGGLLRHTALGGEALALARALVVNQVEFAALFPGGEATAALRRALDAGVEVVVTAGAQGARSLARAGTVEVAAFPVADPAGATGAGDAFTAAYAVAGLLGLDATDRLRAACAAGALSTRAADARTGLPRLDEVTALLRDAAAARPAGA